VVYAVVAAVAVAVFVGAAVFIRRKSQRTSRTTSKVAPGQMSVDIPLKHASASAPPVNNLSPSRSTARLGTDESETATAR